jgi:hypothetical protein
MGVDRTDAGADGPKEAAEEPPPPDRRPPADRPGAEGAPSRADSRDGAAAANDTSSQTTENQSEDKPDTIQAPQETTDREDSTTVENKPETPGTSESNEGLRNDDGTTERRDNSPSQEDLGGRPDTTQPPGGAGQSKDADQRNLALDGQTVPHDTAMPPETDRQAVPADAPDRTEDNGAGETSAADVNNSGSAADIGENPDGAANPDESPLASGADAQEPPPDSLDAPGNVVGDNEREPTYPADGAAETAASPAAEDQPESTDKSQLDRQVAPISAAGSGADAHKGREQAHVDSDRIEDRSGETLEGEEAAANTDDASRSGAERFAGRSESLDDADLGAADQRSAEVAGTSKEEQQGSEVEPITPQPDSTSERTEATWATGGLDIAGDLPTGEELVKMESDKQSRAERARRKIYESGDEVLDDVGKVVNRIDQIFKRPPTGHPETRTGPEVVPAPHDGINVTDATTALIAAGVVVGEIFRRGRERLNQKKGV